MADEAVSLFKCFYERNPYILAPKPHRPVVQRERTWPLRGEHGLKIGVSD
ncbi:hypothetical protein F2Q68_00021859 [Brassica cretica]|uniref:Uncharacterized protein n=1 Tax=Brassica cretica TaxID=69181 RepID=A0A8S9FNT1_BRACR|nr:hypothetical protein F2Q68_00021859 [Brassica cretica]